MFLRVQFRQMQPVLGPQQMRRDPGRAGIGGPTALRPGRLDRLPIGVIGGIRPTPATASPVFSASAADRS